MTTYEITLEEVPARPTLVVPAATTWSEFPTLWKQLLNEVWTCLHANDIRGGCPNVMLYLDDVPHVEVGVLDREQCSPSGRVVRSALPSGRVVTTVHQGPYNGLGDAHEAVHAWCADAEFT
ncbi:hypothetical protein GCM10029964_095460 [Kibdelosporangium lantanae]